MGLAAIPHGSTGFPAIPGHSTERVTENAFSDLPPNNRGMQPIAKQPAFAKQPVAPELRDALRGLVAEMGERGASETVGLSRQTISRVVAGFDCWPGTEAQLDRALRQIGRAP